MDGSSNNNSNNYNVNYLMPHPTPLPTTALDNIANDLRIESMEDFNRDIIMCRTRHYVWSCDQYFLQKTKRCVRVSN